MTEITGIDHIYITVSDLERSEVFYDRVLLPHRGQAEDCNDSVSCHSA